MTDDKLKQQALEYLGIDARLVVERRRAFWQHGRRDTLTVPTPRPLALRIHALMRNRFELIEESGPNGQRTILTPLPCQPDSKEGVYVITKRWMTRAGIADALDVPPYRVKAWLNDTTCPVEERPTKHAKGGKLGIRMWPDTIRDMELYFICTIHHAIKEEGADVRPYRIPMDAKGESVAYLAEEIGLGASYLSEVLLNASITERPVRPSAALRTLMREKYDIEITITQENATA